MVVPFCSDEWRLVIYFEIRDCITTFCSFAQHCLGYLRSYEKWHWNFERDFIESVLLWVIHNVSGVHSSNPWTPGIFPLICVFFRFLLQCLSFQCTGLFLPSQRLFTSILFFDAAINEIVFLDFLFSLLLTRNVTGFWMLLLYPATLLDSSVNYTVFVVESLGFSIDKTILQTKKISLHAFYKNTYCLFLLPDCSPYNFCTVMKRGGKSDILVFHPKGKS